MNEMVIIECSGDIAKSLGAKACRRSGSIDWINPVTEFYVQTRDGQRLAWPICEPPFPVRARRVIPSTWQGGD